LFLGYDPFPEPGSFGARLRKYQMAVGLSQAELGEALGIRAGTIGEFERGRIP
jgi:transcriptional regulator with XRE-family HTH domain